MRLARTGVFALVCLALAAGAHAVAGGGLPPLGVVLLACVPLWFGAFWLTSRRLGAGAIGAALSLAQLGLHGFFHLTAAHLTSAPGDPALTAVGGHPGHLVHPGLAGQLPVSWEAAVPASAGLDLVPGPSVTMLLAHIAAVERVYHVLSFQGRDVTPEDDGAAYWGLTMGKEGTAPARLPTLDELRAELADARAETLRVFAAKDDAWLAEPLGPGWANQHWAWFHVMEDEVNHRGQLRLLRQVLAPEEGG